MRSAKILGVSTDVVSNFGIIATVRSIGNSTCPVPLTLWTTLTNNQISWSVIVLTKSTLHPSCRKSSFNCSLPFVEQEMIGTILANDKIVSLIFMLHFVYVMHFIFKRKSPAQYTFSHKNMLLNISIGISSHMIWTFNRDISMVNMPTTVPSKISWPTCSGHGYTGTLPRTRMPLTRSPAYSISSFSYSVIFLPTQSFISSP